jgi:hypothetical protein
LRPDISGGLPLYVPALAGCETSDRLARYAFIQNGRRWNSLHRRDFSALYFSGCFSCGLFGWTGPFASPL